jgi:hypothetical protein
MKNGNATAGDAATSGQYSVAAAARILGIGERAVRWRIQTGALAAERDGHGWHVFLPADAAATTAENGNGGNTAAGNGNDAADHGSVAAELAIARALLAAVEAERDHLWALVERGDQERAELRRLLAGALQRPALPSGEESVAPTKPPPWWATFWPWRRASE